MIPRGRTSRRRAARTRTYVVANVHGGSNPEHVRFLKWFRSLAPDALIACEANGFHDVLRRAGHLYAGSGSHGSREVAVVLTGKPATSHETRQLTQFIQRRGSKPLLWHDRWNTRVTRGIFRQVVIHSTHANAVIQNRESPARPLFNNAGAREWRRGQAKLEAMLAADMRKNRRVRHGCDANQVPGSGPDNPAQMYRRLGMEYVQAELMWFAWNPRRDDLVSFKVLPTPPGSDGHPTLVVTLRRIPLRRRLTRTHKEKP